MRTAVCCIVIVYLNIYATCNKRIDCKQTIYSFEVFYKAYPDRDSIRIKNTIWFELNTPTQLKNLINNTTTDYNGAENFGTAISFLEIVGGDFLDPGVVPAANSFENVLKIGVISPTDKQDQIRAYRFKEENGRYVFKLGIVAKKKGSFMIAPGDAANVYRKSNKCDKAGFSLTFTDTDQHLYLYEQKRPGYVLSDYDRGHLYAFKVY